MILKTPIREGVKKEITKIGLHKATIGHRDSIALTPNVNFEYTLGKIIWVTGASGSGKSTLLKTLTGLISPVEGQLYINDHDVVSEMSFEEFMPYRLNIGYSFEMGGLLNNRTLWDNLMLPLLYHRAANYRDAELRVGEVFKMFAIERYKNERPASVPGGIRKAACVARSFMLDPQILILDEPMTGLNEEGIGALFTLLKERETSSLVFITSRDVHSMERIADEELKLEINTVTKRIIRGQEKQAV